MPVTLPPKKKLNQPFLMLGDSLVAGFNWQSRIPHFSIRNCGIPGATSRELLETIPRLKKNYPSAQLIMLMMGTNDIIMNNYDFIDDLKKTMVFLINNYPGAELLVNSLLPMQYPGLGKKTVIGANTHIEILCRKTGACYVDVHAKFLRGGDALFQEDGVHLTEVGYELWARTVLEHIAFLLEND